jgi:integrase
MNTKNPNAPKLGSTITVEPIRRFKDIRAIAKLLHDNPRNHLLFVLGVNSGLRAGDLLKLKAKKLRGLKYSQQVVIKESKTKKANVFFVNKAILAALDRYFSIINPADDDFVFKSREGINKPITIQAVNNMIKKWTKAINLSENYGAHTLRKTWGYMVRTKFNEGFEVICKRYNHSTPAVTMRYLGITDKEVKDCLMHEIS